jgi:hypothetical protein
VITDINGEDRLVQQTFTEHLEKALSWESIYAYKAETFGPIGALGRASERNVVLVGPASRPGCPAAAPNERRAYAPVTAK